jgi:solute:Na+ symporter, SSS family
MQSGALGPLGAAIIPAYLAAILLISIATRRRTATSNDYLNASRSLPTWAAALSFLAFNCGSIEIIGMSAMAAQYGIQALHFYWIGGIPGMIFLGIVVVPIYMRTGARSLPEYLQLRFGPNVRLLNALISLVGTAALAGAALYAMAHVLHVILGWSVMAGALASASVVLIYVLLGGVRATIYTSIFQLIVMLGGLVPLLFKTFPFDLHSFSSRPDRWHLWQTLPGLSPHATLDRFGVAFGLGFVISFSYWCTDFVIIQRTLTARTIEGARQVPVLAGFGKLLIAFLIVLPGVAAGSVFGARPVPFDETIPALMATLYGPTLLGLGIAALLAGLMAGFAGNVSGFSAAWTEELYRTRILPRRSEKHYIWVGRLAVVACFLLAALAAYAATRFRDLMEFLQLIVSLFYAPLFAIVLIGAGSRRATERHAFRGILIGVASGVALQLCFHAHVIRFGSQMTADFYIALCSFSVATVAGAALGPRPAIERKLPKSNAAAFIRPSLLVASLSVLLLVACAVFNWLWW